MSMLKKLMPDYQGVVDFEFTEDKKGMIITEGCDGYFSEIFSKAEFGQLIEELRALHAQMVDL